MSTFREQRLLPLVQTYFVEHLRRVRGASPHTIRAYAHALRLFFIFVADRSRTAVADLTLDHVPLAAVRMRSTPRRPRDPLPS